MRRKIEVLKSSFLKNEKIVTCILAASFFEKLKGLIGKKDMNEDKVLLFKNAPSIHTFFMSFPIDIIFLDKNFKVISISKNIKRGKIINCFGSKYTIEAKAFFSEKMNLEIGDKLKINYLDKRRNTGQVTIEYALIIAILVVGIISLWPTFAETVETYISSIVQFLSDI